jgi:hypothetical protein
MAWLLSLYRGPLAFSVLWCGFARVPRVYLSWANPVFLAFFSFNEINNFRVLNVAFSPIPTAPTSFSFPFSGGR